jgi:hypothetical protein
VNKLFADNRQRVIATIRAWGNENGLPAGLVTRVIDGLLPSIRLAAKKGDTAQHGGCRAGGLPDLPKGMQWPRVGAGDAGTMPMSLVLQVTLADVASFDVNHLLPADGLLSLFYYWEDSGGDEGRLVYFSAPVPPLHQRQAPADMPEENCYPARALEPVPEWTLPRFWSLSLSRGDAPDLETWFDLQHRVSDVQGLAKVEGLHRLLGHADLIQSSGLGDGEMLVLQAGSEDMEWGDGGMLYSSLSTADLRARRFEAARVWLEMG